MSGCLSDLALDAVVAGERSAVDAHLEGCTACQKRLELFRAMREQNGPRVDRLIARAQATPRPEPGWSRWWSPSRLAVLAGAAACLALVWVVGVRRTEVDQIRAKGEAVKFYRLRDGVVAPGVSGESFRPGDALRFTVTTGEPTWFLLVGIEADGKVSAYHPWDGKTSVRIPAGADQALPGSLVLDEARGTEFIVALFSREPLPIDRVRAAAARRKGETLDVPAHQHWIVIRKEAK